MVKRLLLLSLAAFALGAQAQYQIKNGDFEEWTDKTTEPRYWHGFKSAKGLLAGSAPGTLEKSSDVRSGVTGYSALITSGSVFGIVGNGTMTTGQLNAGNMSASSTDNHAEMDKSSTAEDKNADKFYMPLTGYPDSIKFWLKFQPQKTSYKASVNAVITDGSYYQDPEDKTYNNKVAVAKNTSIAKCDWKEIKINFDYASYESNNKAPAAIMCTFGTNATPGGGASGDKVYIDDVVLVYNSELASATFDGVDVEFTEGEAFFDAEYDPDLLELTKNAKGGVIETDYDSSTALLTITVKGDNISEDTTNYHTYTIQFNLPSSELKMAQYDGKRFRFNNENVGTIRLYEAFDINKVTLTTVSDNATTEKAYNSVTKILTITVKGSNFADDPTNFNTYTANVIIKDAPTVVAGSSKTYEDDIVVTVNGATSDPQLAKIIKSTMDDGTVQFVIKNFKLTSPQAINVGNIVLSDVTIKADGTFSTNQEIQLENGDEEGVNNWMGPIITTQSGGSVPIDMTGKISDYALYVTIDIDLMDVMGQIIYVQFGYDFMNYTLSSEYGTICIPTAAALPDGVMAYTCASVTNSVLDLTDATSIIEANTPYILQKTGTEASYSILTTVKSDTEVHTVGCLKGVLAATTAPTGSYVLQNLDNKVAFYQVSAEDPITVPANRCYLDLDNNVSGSIKALAFPDGTQTSISSIQAQDAQEAAIYDLSGRRVSKTTKGIYIINGKKVIK